MPEELRTALRTYANPEKAAFLPRFFKAGPGEYGEGDKFLGVSVPSIRKVVSDFWKSITNDELDELFKSPWHEERLLATLLLVKKYQKAGSEQQEQLLNYYLQLLRNNRINNWDLVDSSAYLILGHYLSDKDKFMLFDMIQEANLWVQRAAVVSTYAFIKNGHFETTTSLCAELMEHKHDLMHKACGWMLREAGNRNEAILIDFLDIWYQKMPRTMLRYAIEKLEDPLRMEYLKGLR